jgi:ferric enterobactin receptor
MKKLLQTIFFFLAILTAQAQIKGTVVDSLTSKPVAFVTVSLVSGDKTLKGALTNESGQFLLSQIPDGTYHIRFTAVGFKQETQQILLKDSLNLGFVKLKENGTNLSEVTVTGTKAIIEQEADRLIYDTQADPESKVLNVLDMMRKIPYLSLDGDDNLSLKDSRDFRIFVNGRPSAMMARNYKDILKSMSASSIQKIEVITTPPSKYDGEGLSGIINIITSRNLDNGFMGNVNLSWNNPIGGPGIGTTLTARLGKWGISGFTGGSLNDNPTYNFLNERNTRGQELSSLKQSGSSESSSKSAYLGVELSYELDTLNLFTGQFNVSGNASNSLNMQRSVLLLDDELGQQYVLNNFGDASGQSKDIALNYQKTARKNKKQLFTASYQYSAFDNLADNRILLTEKINYTQTDYTQSNRQSTNEHTGQMDMVFPLKKWMLEGGLKGIFRTNESRFGTEHIGNEDAIKNDFFNTQNVFSVYNSFRYSAKKWSVSGGFRLENTVLDVDFLSSGVSISKNYYNLLPTIAVNRNLGKNSVGISYMERIQRPGIYQLNPFVDRTNPDIERTGNPDLLPSVMQDLSLKYSYSGKSSINASVGLISIRDMLFPVIVYNPDTKITLHSYNNVGKARLLPAIMVGINRQISKQWSFNINSRWMHATVEGVVNGEKVVNKGMMYGGYAGVGYRSQKGWRLNANFNYNGPSINIQEVRVGYLHSSVSVNKDILKGKLNLAASINNPFTEYRRNITDGFGPDFTFRYEQNNYFRSFRVSLNYKFGKLKDGVKKSSRSIRNDDVKNGE